MSKRRPDKERELRREVYFAMLFYKNERVWCGDANQATIRKELEGLIDEVLNPPHMKSPAALTREVGRDAPPG